MRPAFALRDNVFDVKCGSLEALVHQAILAPLTASARTARDNSSGTLALRLPARSATLATDERHLLAQFHQRRQFFPFRFWQKPFVVAIHQRLKPIVRPRWKPQITHRCNPVHRRGNRRIHAINLRHQKVAVNARPRNGGAHGLVRFVIPSEPPK